MSRPLLLILLVCLALLRVLSPARSLGPLAFGPPYAADTDPVPPRHYLTAPADLPAFEAARWPGELGEGYLFVSMYSMDTDAARFNMILDDNGEPVYYARQEHGRYDFKKLPDGTLTYYTSASGAPAYAVLDDHYRPVREIKAAADPQTGQSYNIDLHDLQLLPDGHALILIHDEHIVDMSRYHPDAGTAVRVLGCVVQELDQNNAVVFQWRSWDHIPIDDTYEPLTSDPLRYIHCNSIEQDSDGNLLLSSRNLNEITKINRESGDIIWRLGGKQNDFLFLNDVGFSVQHDARRLLDGHITIYDNANWDKQPSRGVEYSVDEKGKTVIKEAEFRKIPAAYGWSMGNMQRLPNGNTLIGWGSSSEPVLTEFDSKGGRLLELRSDFRIVSYRAFRFPWRGYPTELPSLVAYAVGRTAHLHFSWNGSTETVAYLITGAQDPAAIKPLARVERDGFETTLVYDLPADGLWYFRVRPVDRQGNVGPPSAIATVVAGGESVYLPLVTGH